MPKTPMSIKPIKICFVTTVPITLKCFVLDFAKFAYENYGWDVTFVCDADQDFADILPHYIRYEPVPMKRGMSFDFFRVVMSLRRIFQQENFDIVQYSTPNASLYASVAAKLANIPIRLYCQWGMAYVGFEGLNRAVFKAEEKLVCSLSTWVEPDSMSNLTFSHAEGLYPESKGSVVWNGSACGVDLEKFDYKKKAKLRSDVRLNLGIPENAFVFGFVGRITRDKGINELFEASRTVIGARKNTYLLLVGGKEFDDSVDASLVRWSYECSEVIYIGYTDHVEEYLAAMDCYVLPSYREGFGMAVVEAEAMGVPVIVTDIPGPVDAMEEGRTGCVVPAKDVESLLDAMDRMARGGYDLGSMSKCAVDYAAKKFDRNILFQKIVDDRHRLINEADRR